MSVLENNVNFSQNKKKIGGLYFLEFIMDIIKGITLLGQRYSLYAIFYCTWQKLSSNNQQTELENRQKVYT